jgi:hypothetical protein
MSFRRWCERKARGVESGERAGEGETQQRRDQRKGGMCNWVRFQNNVRLRNDSKGNSTFAYLFFQGAAFDLYSHFVVVTG